MIPGVGFSELLVIFVLILLFFGSKEIPQLMRQAGKFYRKARTYTDAVKREIDEITRDVDPAPTYSQEAVAKKKLIREKSLAARKSLSAEERAEKSAKIIDILLADPIVAVAKAIMVYAALNDEVATADLITKLAAAGRRLVLPYCREPGRSLGIASIADFDKETAIGTFGVLEPIESVRDNFFKSDIGLIICPGVGFDLQGSRIGYGKGYYDNFLRELKGKTPVWALAFDCQISTERFPFDYHDVTMDQVVTESGLLIKNQ